jgi:predicted ATPase
VENIRRAIARWKELHATLALTLYSTLLADACLHSGEVDEGLAVTATAINGDLGTQERCYHPELHRLRGELLRLKGDREGAVAAFEAGLAAAVEQEAKSFEFRGVISLLRAANPMKAAEARRRLFVLCSWFDDKGETPDMQAAREVLLSRPY